MWNPYEELTEEEYVPVKGKIEGYLLEIRMNEADVALRRESIRTLEGYLKSLHHTGSNVKDWLYSFMKREVLKSTNERLKDIWNEYKRESLALKSQAAANPRRSRTSRPLPVADLSSLLEGPSGLYPHFISRTPPVPGAAYQLLPPGVEAGLPDAAAPSQLKAAFLTSRAIAHGTNTQLQKA
ncbi:hypothetical protein B0H11DRAFT_14373 [Mycena galericulata]|nr:hypothetical protein B0H11DRAFT_14373 [Mycena galericulata]